MTEHKDKPDLDNVGQSSTESNPDDVADSNTVAGETAEERALRKRIEELRKRDPFIYR